MDHKQHAEGLQRGGRVIGQTESEGDRSAEKEDTGPGSHCPFVNDGGVVVGSQNPDAWSGWHCRSHQAYLPVLASLFTSKDKRGWLMCSPIE